MTTTAATATTTTAIVSLTSSNTILTPTTSTSAAQQQQPNPLYLPFSVWMLLNGNQGPTTNTYGPPPAFSTQQPPQPVQTIYITKWLDPVTVQVPGETPPPNTIFNQNTMTVYVYVTVGPPSTPTPTPTPAMSNPCLYSYSNLEIVCISSDTFQLCTNQAPAYARPKSCRSGTKCCPAVNSCVPAASCSGYVSGVAASPCLNKTDGTAICTSNTTYNTCWNNNVLVTPDPACAAGGLCCRGRCDYSGNPHCSNLTGQLSTQIDLQNWTSGAQAERARFRRTSGSGNMLAWTISLLAAITAAAVA